MPAAATKRIMSHTEILALQGQRNYGKEREKPTGLSAYHGWHTRVASALRWRESHWNGDKNWRRAYRLFGGKHWRYVDEPDPSADEARDLITVNVTMSVVNNMVPYLINSNPLYVTKPRKPAENVSAMLQQEILNYEFEKQNTIEHIKECILDAAIIGHGVFKTGYTYEIDEAVSKQSGQIVYEDWVQEETPYGVRVDPFMFLFDPTASDKSLRTARWCAEMFFKTFDDVVENSSYDSSVRNKIKNGFYTPTVIDTSTEFGGAYNTSDHSVYDTVNYATQKIVKLFEIWDKKHRKRLVFADGVEEPLVEAPWPYTYLKGFPYRKLDFIKIPNEHYGVGIPYSIEDQQFELDRSRTSMFQHRRRFNRKYEVDEKLNETEYNKLIDGSDGTVVRVKQVGAQIGVINDAPMSQDHWQTDAMIKGDIMELSGMDALIRGGPLPSRTSSNEISTRVQSFRMKVDDLVDRCDKFVLGIGKDFLAHIKANTIKERVVHILGLQGEFWVNVLPADIKAEVDVSMESVASPKTNPETEKQQALNLLNISVQMQEMLIQMQSPEQINLIELFKWMLEKFGYKDTGRFFKPMLVPNQPLQEGTQQAGSNGLPSLNGKSPAQPMNSSDLQAQFGQAAIKNSGNLGF